MLSLSRFAKNYELFSNLYATETFSYDFKKTMDFFKLWDKLDLDEYMQTTNYAKDMKNLIMNTGLTKTIKYNKPHLAKDVFMHMMTDQYFCCMAYMLGRNQNWINEYTILSETTKGHIAEIAASKYPSTILSMHYGPYRAWPMFLQLFKQKFLVPHTENEYTAIFEKNRITDSDQINFAMVDDSLVQKLNDSYKEARSIFLLADYSVSPRKSDRTANLFGNKIHAPAGSIRLAQKNSSSLYITRIKSIEPCHFEIVVEKIIDRSEWSTADDTEQLNSAVDKSFNWITKTIEDDPIPWQGWHRYNLILSESEK